MLQATLTLLVSGVIFLLHGMAGAPGEASGAMAALCAGMLLLVCLGLGPSRRRLLTLAMAGGGPVLALGLGGGALGAALGERAASWALALSNSTALGAVAAIAAGAGLARLLGRRAFALAIAGGGGIAALWAVLAGLTGASGGVREALFALSLEQQARAAGAVFAVSVAAGAFVLGEEAARRAHRNETLDPLHRRLTAPAAILAAGLLGLGFVAQPGAALAAAVGAAAAALGLAARGQMAAAALAGLPSLVAAGLVLTAPNLGAWRLSWPTPSLELGVVLGAFLGVALSASWMPDAGRRPSRGFALALALLATSAAQAVAGDGLISPSATISAALLLGAALGYSDAPRRSRRKHSASAALDVTKPLPVGPA